MLLMFETWNKQRDAHWSPGASRRSKSLMRSWAGRLRRLLVPEQRGQMTVPAPRQCAHLLTNSSSHRVRAWLITMAKEATCSARHGQWLISRGCKSKNLYLDWL